MTFLDFIVSLHNVIHVRLKKEDGKGGKEGGREERTEENKTYPYTSSHMYTHILTNGIVLSTSFCKPAFSLVLSG